MKPPTLLTITLGMMFLVNAIAEADELWIIDSQSEWTAETIARSSLEIKDGLVSPTGEKATLRSKLKTFENKRTARSIVFEQSPIWQNWEPVSNIGPSNLRDAPVMLCLGPNNYWMFGRYGSGRKKGDTSKQPQFEPEAAKLEGHSEKTWRRG